MTAKGNAQKLISGDEQDAVSQRARKFLSFRAGERTAIKRKLNKRARWEAKQNVNKCESLKFSIDSSGEMA